MLAKQVHEVYRQAFPALAVDFAAFIEALRIGEEGIRVLTHAQGDKVVAACVYGQKGISLLAVIPPYQNKGIGTKLLKEAQQEIAALGGQKISLGNGMPYIWQGVPVLEKSAVPFFEKHGYQNGGETHDMVLALSDLSESVRPSVDIAIEIGFGEESERAALLKCVDIAIPSWRGHHETIPMHNVLMARYEGTPIGFITVRPQGMVMNAAFDGTLGWLSHLAVDPAYRRHGTGLYLAYKATEYLRNLGHKYAYIDYTTLNKWYERLGYHTFLRFWMGYKDL